MKATYIIDYAWLNEQIEIWQDRSIDMKYSEEHRRTAAIKYNLLIEVKLNCTKQDS